MADMNASSDGWLSAGGMDLSTAAVFAGDDSTNGTDPLNGSDEAGRLSREDEAVLLVTRFVLYGVLGNGLVLLGLLGNSLSVLVLSHRLMRSSTSYYLTSLAVYDNLILLSMLLFFNLPAVGAMVPALRSAFDFAALLPAGYPLSLAAQMGSIYTCLAFTVERYVAVCRPLHAPNTCTKARAKRAIALIVVWALVYNVPRCFHYATRTARDPHTQQEETQLVVTEFGRSPVFRHVYIIYLQLLFMFLLPFLVLLALNAALIRALRRSSRQRQRMTTSTSTEHSLTVMLVAVTAVFLLCQCPTIVDNILVAVVGEERHSQVLHYQLLYAACTCLVTLNSSVNFALYCLFGNKFRRVLSHILAVRAGTGRGSHPAYRSTLCLSKHNGVKPSSNTDHMDVSFL